MVNTMRWRYGETNPVVLPVLTGFVVNIGDLLYLDGNNVKPAANQPNQGTVDANQELFHDNFVGVAMQASTGDQSENVRIATSGVFEYDCASATFEVGDLLGSADDGSGTALEGQIVVAVATPNLAVGRCVKQVSPAGTKVLVDIVSTVVRGGPQAAA
ncbi:MAG: DUF2190 family protein [Pirellulales bacterium]|nr:DUF2190 family protein [Pirellulales bacterium]